MKKVILFALIMCLILSSTNIYFSYEKFADDKLKNETENSLDEFDLWVVLGMHIVAEKSDSSSPWSTSTKISQYIPLYDLNDNIIAYYVTLTDGGYIVVNNNKDNPIVLEFGYDIIGTDLLVNSSKLSSIGDEKIYYFGFGGFFKADKDNNLEQSDKILKNINEKAISDVITVDEIRETSKMFNKFINDDNLSKKQQFETYKNYALEILGNRKNEITFIENPVDWGIFDSSILPGGSFSGGNIIGYNNLSYGTTYEFENIDVLGGVNNHCGATSAFNMVLYSRYRIGNPVQVNQRIDLFKGVHGYIGNGPTLPSLYVTGFNAYVNYDTNYTPYAQNLGYSSWSNYKSYINNDRMIFMVIWPQLLKAHYINGIGYREYSGGDDKFCRVVDNWNDNTNRWYYWPNDLYAFGYAYFQ